MADRWRCLGPGEPCTPNARCTDNCRPILDRVFPLAECDFDHADRVLAMSVERIRSQAEWERMLGGENE